MSNGKLSGMVALAALTVLSCKSIVDGASPSAGDNASVTSAGADPGATTTPAQLPAAGKPAGVVSVPAGASPETTPAARIETPAVQPTPAVLEAVHTEEGRLGGIASGVQGASVRFVDCAEAAACTTRLEATSLSGLRDLLQAVSKDQGGISFVAREQLDAYTGQKFVADVTLGGTTTRPVPTDENELLVNNDTP